MREMIIVISVCTTFSLLTVLMSCLCWKKKRQKSEWGGLDGFVKQKNPDENVNYFPSITVQTVADAPKAVTADIVDASRLIVNPRRSLPDIPSEGSGLRNEGETVLYEPNGDNSSELYATVEPYSNARKQTYANGIESRASISQHSSISQADDAFSPYARVNYDKLKKVEHPYACVQNVTHPEQDGDSSDEIPTTSNAGERHSSGLNMDPIAPPRSRRSSVHSSIVGDIPAASAVAGSIAANQELPYMTPPLIQPNFSGDSQDSQKGYTSISVREPLANIIAQTKDLNKNKSKRELDPHYSTVSDDSDEMYTTIQDPNNQVYTSGSETYAQIQPIAITVAAEVNPVPTFVRQNAEEEELERRDDLYEPPPQPQPQLQSQPQTDRRKHVGGSHSRQASSSSSIANLGSPKPEKRQANSPLPPPPTVSPDLHNQEKIRLIKAVDEMYAKVHKNKKKTEENDTNSDKSQNNSKISSRTSLNEENNTNEREINDRKLNVNESEHNYETLKKNRNDPGYEKLKIKDEDSGSEPGYASINGPSSLSFDPGYEVLKKNSNSNSDPNYEELRHDNLGYSTIAQSCVSEANSNSLSVPSLVMDGYSVISKQKKSDDRSKTSSFELDLTLDEPNYESMPSECSDHNYSQLKSTDSESDPNYESVNRNEPNYESVNRNEPKYESVKYASSKKNDYGYSKVNKKKNDSLENDSTKSNTESSEEPPYEKLQDDLSRNSSDDNTYEKVVDKDGDKVDNSCDKSVKNDNNDSVYLV